MNCGPRFVPVVFVVGANVTRLASTMLSVNDDGSEPPVRYWAEFGTSYHVAPLLLFRTTPHPIAPPGGVKPLIDTTQFFDVIVCVDVSVPYAVVPTTVGTAVDPADDVEPLIQ